MSPYQRNLMTLVASVVVDSGGEKKGSLTSDCTLVDLLGLLIAALAGLEKRIAGLEKTTAKSKPANRSQSSAPSVVRL